VIYFFLALPGAFSMQHFMLGEGQATSSRTS